ncbi:hypothetical protein V6N13_101064 [Hibiscus sabdariffa]
MIALWFRPSGGNKINASSLQKAHFDRINNKLIPRALREAPTPPAPRQQVAPVLEGDVSLASLSELITQMEGNKINASSLRKAHSDLINNELIPRAPREALTPRQQVAPVLEGDVSLASLSELITQMEGRIMRRFDSVDECLDILEYSLQLL